MKSGNEYALLIPVTEHWVFTRLQFILLTIVIDVKNIFNLMIHLVIVVPYLHGPINRNKYNTI